MSKAKKQQDGIKIKGMFRVHIEENGKIVGDFRMEDKSSN